MDTHNRVATDAGVTTNVRVATDASAGKDWVVCIKTPYTEEHRRLDEALRRIHRGAAIAKVSRSASWTTRDSWGPVCSHCEWSGQAHKPCAACEGGRL